MKTPRSFTQNRLSYLRIPAGVTLIAAAVVSAIASFNPDPPNTRLTNDNGANGGYISPYKLATRLSYTGQTPDEGTVAPGRQDAPAGADPPRNSRLLPGH